jgi:hypothetical protein
LYAVDAFHAGAVHAAAEADAIGMTTANAPVTASATTGATIRFLNTKSLLDTGRAGHEPATGPDCVRAAT